MYRFAVKTYVREAATGQVDVEHVVLSIRRDGEGVRPRR
jgi:hypothetical protein